MLLCPRRSAALLLLLLALLVPDARGLIRCWEGHLRAKEQDSAFNYSLSADVVTAHGRPPPMLRVERCWGSGGVKLLAKCAVCLREEVTEGDGPLPHHDIRLTCLKEARDCPACTPKRPHTRCSSSDMDSRGQQVTTMCCNFSRCTMGVAFNEKVACGALAPGPVRLSRLAALAMCVVALLRRR